MRKELCIGFYAVVFALMGATQSSLAAEPEPVASASPSSTQLVVSQERVNKESTAIQHILKAIEQQTLIYQKHIAEQEQVLQKEYSQLKNDPKKVPAKKLESQQVAFQEKVEKMKKTVENRRNHLESAHRKAMEKFKKVFLGILNRIAAAKGAVLISSAENFMWSDPSIDITSEVIKELNKEIPKIDVVFPSEKDLDKPDLLPKKTASK